MFVACIHLHVKPENREAFFAATLENARQTIEEPGNLRFDVLQLADDPNRFMYYEVYRDEAGMKAHKETAHYARWAALVPDLLVEPRNGIRYGTLFPETAQQWSAKGISG
jgi:(4S)-4-hydroxy-5-phosphonooxypentane-2,3-dione isomerase